jgi:hypothetical protein
MAPKRFEVRCHGDQPIADRVVADKLVLLPSTLPFLLGFGQCTQLVVSFAFKCIRNETVTRINQHISPLRETRFDLSAFDGATVQPIGLLVSSFGLSPSANSTEAGVIFSTTSLPIASSIGTPEIHWQCDSPRDYYARGRQRTMPPVFRAAQHIGRRDVCCIEPTHRAPLQESHPLSRWRRWRQFVPATVGSDTTFGSE